MVYSVHQLRFVGITKKIPSSCLPLQHSNTHMNTLCRSSTMALMVCMRLFVSHQSFSKAYQGKKIVAVTNVYPMPNVSMIGDHQSKLVEEEVRFSQIIILAILWNMHKLSQRDLQSCKSCPLAMPTWLQRCIFCHLAAKIVYLK